MIKQSVVRKLPVLMQDTAGAPVTGLAYGDVSVKYAKEGDASLSTKTLAASPVEWFEIGQGLYDILFDTDELDTIGFFKYFVTGTGALQYPGLVQISERLVDDIVNDVWDELITPAYHNIKNSAGRSLFKIPAIIIHSGTAEGSGTGNNQIELDGDASVIDGIYDPAIVCIIEGTGAGQSRLILDYVGATKICTVDGNWRVNPDDTSEFIIIADAGREHVNEGLAQDGSVSTITLNDEASSVDDFYKCQLVYIRSGPGAGEVASVMSYVGSTRVATVCHSWNVIPTTQSAYIVLPQFRFQILLDEINANEEKIDTAIEDIGTVDSKVVTAIDDISVVDGKVDIIDGNVDLILTGTISINSKVDIMDSNIDLVLEDTNEMQGKLPANNIMGSGVKTDKDGEIDAIKLETDKIQTVDNNVDILVARKDHNVYGD